MLESEKRLNEAKFFYEKAKKTELGRLLFGLGIRFVGEQASDLVSALIEQKNSSEKEGENLTLKKVGKIGESVTAEEWQAIEGIGERIGNSLFEWFHDKPLEVFPHCNRLEILFSFCLLIFPDEARPYRKLLSARSHDQP